MNPDLAMYDANLGDIIDSPAKQMDLLSIESCQTFLDSRPPEFFAVMRFVVFLVVGKSIFPVDVIPAVLALSHRTIRASPS